MLLAIDVGNSNISFGVFQGPLLTRHFRCESARARTPDEYAIQVRQMLELGGIAPSAIQHAIVASVVPTLTETMVGLVERAFGCSTLVVGPGIRTGMPILYDNPKEVGADRIVNAVAAYEWAKQGVIVVDFGTATTFDCVTSKGEYLGGVIAPGVHISAEALFSRAARLHRVELAAPPRAVGRNAVHSMQSGIVFGYAALVDGLCARLRAELGYAPGPGTSGSSDRPPCRVVATGGLARLITAHTSSVEMVDDDLTLDGLRLLFDRNREPASV